MTKKAAVQKKQKSMEETLWNSANKLRGSIEPSEYKHVVLGLIFLKFISDKFEERREELVAEGKESYVDMVEFYAMKNVFYLPEESRWSYIKKNAQTARHCCKNRYGTSIYQLVAGVGFEPTTFRL